MNAIDIGARSVQLGELTPENYWERVEGLPDLYGELFPAAPPLPSPAFAPVPDLIYAAIELASEAGSPVPEEVRQWLYQQPAPDEEEI